MRRIVETQVKVQCQEEHFVQIEESIWVACDGESPMILAVPANKLRHQIKTQTTVYLGPLHIALWSNDSTLCIVSF